MNNPDGPIHQPLGPQCFPAPAAYNSAYPDAVIGLERSEGRCRYDAGGAGIEDDLVASGAIWSIGFVPGGAPAPGEVDRMGNVVATRGAEGSVWVLAERVSLRAAWRTICAQWPQSLSGLRSALTDSRLHTGKTLSPADDAVACGEPRLAGQALVRTTYFAPSLCFDATVDLYGTRTGDGIDECADTR